MTITLYLDEDSQQDALVVALRSHNVDVLTSGEAGMNGSNDAAQLAFANAQGRVLFTYNTRDFLPLHKQYLTQGLTHAGLIVSAQQQFSIGEQMRSLVKIVQTKTAEEMRDYVEFLSDWK